MQVRVDGAVLVACEFLYPINCTECQMKVWRRESCAAIVNHIYMFTHLMCRGSPWPRRSTFTGQADIALTHGSRNRPDYQVLVFMSQHLCREKQCRALNGMENCYICVQLLVHSCHDQHHSYSGQVHTGRLLEHGEGTLRENLSSHAPLPWWIVATRSRHIPRTDMGPQKNKTPMSPGNDCNFLLLAYIQGLGIAYH